MNTADYLLQNSQEHSVAIVTKEGAYTYGEIKQAAARLAGELVSLGIQPGDRIGLLSQNSLFWVAAYLAILKIGAVAAPFSHLDHHRRLEPECRVRRVQSGIFRKTPAA